jgi:hypothetical protein
VIGLPKITAVVGIPLAAGVAAGEAFADEHLKLISYLIAAVTVTIGAVTFLRNQTKEQIKLHAREDQQRHRRVLDEIRHIRELLAMKLDAPEFAPTITAEMEIVTKEE